MVGESHNIKEMINEECIYLQEKLQQLNLRNIQVDENLARSLIAAFEQLIIDLRKDIENNSPILLQQLYGELYGESTTFPTKTIVELQPDSGLPKQTKLPIGTKIEVKKMYFSSLEEIDLWPINIYTQEIISSNNFTDRENSLPSRTSHLIKIRIKSLNLALKNLPINELRFFVHGKNSEMLITNLFLSQSNFTVYTADSRDRNQPNWYKTATIEYDFPKTSNGVEILKDYVSLPEMYQFFKIKNFDLSNVFEDLIIYIPVDLFNPTLEFELRLFNFLFINKFSTTTYPMVIDLQSTSQLVMANNFDKNIKIFHIDKMKLVGTEQIIENWHSYKLNGATYISFVSNQNNDLLAQNGKKVYGEAIVHNGAHTNKIKINDEINMVTYRNIKGYVQNINEYMELEENMTVLQTYINTDFKLLLSDINSFKNHLNNLLLLFANSYNLSLDEITVQNQVEVIRWNQCPLPIPTKTVNISFKTTKQEIWIFLNVLHHFISELSLVQNKIILNTKWKGHNYVVGE